MRALVISGGGKGIRWRCRTISLEEKKINMIFFGTSTGSLLIPHLPK
jgi:hypothetical protein